MTSPTFPGKKGGKGKDELLSSQTDFYCCRMGGPANLLSGSHQIELASYDFSAIAIFQTEWQIGTDK